MPRNKNLALIADIVLLAILAAILIIHYFHFLAQKWDDAAVMAISYIATLLVVRSALISLKNKKISIDLLASIALAVSIIEGQWTSVIFINLMITSARIFSEYTKNRSYRAIESLLKLKPQKAKIKKDGEFVDVPIEMVKKGDLVLVELGETIPVDGIIEKGEAEVNQASLTGESLPVFKKIGDKVFSSTIVVSGNLIVRSEKIGEETTFSKVIQLVGESRKYKAPISALSSQFAGWYVVLTLAGSVLLYLFSRDISLVLAVLLVSCADDIAVAVPLAFLTSISHAAAKHGAVIKGGDFLEALSKLKVIVLDKTGTLTRGKLKVEEVFAFGNHKNEEVLEIAEALSSMSNHPSSQAIFKYARAKKISGGEPEDFQEYAGKGAAGIYKNKKIASGKLSFFEDLKINISEHQLADINREKERGLSITLISSDNELIGFMALADELRPKTKESISALKKLGARKIVMLTGDNEKIAQRVSDAVGIKEFHANLLPEDKLAYLKKYLGPRHKTAMVGDGVNDAAALSLADVGIAMGAIGSDAAIQSADIALMKDDLTQIPELIKIGKSTLAVVKQDLLIWGAVNIIGLVLVFTHVLGPDGAAAYNFLTDFLPPLNSLRLFK